MKNDIIKIELKKIFYHDIQLLIWEYLQMSILLEIRMQELINFWKNDLNKCKCPQKRELWNLFIQLGWDKRIQHPLQIEFFQTLPFFSCHNYWHCVHNFSYSCYSNVDIDTSNNNICQPSIITPEFISMNPIIINNKISAIECENPAADTIYILGFHWIQSNQDIQPTISLDWEYNNHGDIANLVCEDTLQTILYHTLYPEIHKNWQLFLIIDDYLKLCCYAPEN